MASALQIIQALSEGLVVPNDGRNIYKDECALSFDSPESPEGVFINLKTFLAYGADYVEQDHLRTGNRLYLQQKWTVKPKEEQEQQEEVKVEEPPQKRPTKMAIGVEGGFDADLNDHPEFIKHWNVVVFPERLSVPHDNPDLPALLKTVIETIQVRGDASNLMQAFVWEDKPAVSVFAKDLVQLDNGIKISSNPKSWRCQESGLNENLWLNLSTGYIGSGRANWDGTGGTGAALRHFEETGRQYPLVVKLGTITPKGADVYSYAEDEMVEDPYLAQHLAHWGIDILQLTITDKTMSELLIDYNVNYDFGRQSEAGVKLEELSGPGFIGLKNLGNSCYCNSVYQVLFATSAFRQRYFDRSFEVLMNPPDNPPDHLITQLSKLGVGLLSNRYVEQKSIAPKTLRALVGKGHPLFSTGEQQDAAEYLQHVLKLVSRSEVARNGDPADDVSRQFTFEMETRLECLSSHQVRYQTVKENVLEFAVPLEAVTNLDQYNEFIERQKAARESHTPFRESPVFMDIPFEAVLENFLTPSRIEGFQSPVSKLIGSASHSHRLKTFPNYLVIRLAKYTLAENWTSKKLDVSIDFPEELNLEALRSKGPQEGEQLMEDAGAPAAIKPSAEIVDAMVNAFGFGENASKRAAVATKNQGTEEAVQWLLEHGEDADINDPLESEKPKNSSAAFVADPESLAMITALGISDNHASRGLKETGGDVERAVDWCFNHDEEISMEDEGASSSSGGSGALEVVDGPASYRLLGFINHIGSGTSSGHYACHIKKDGKWAIFNDSSVAASLHPSKDLGYVYIYERSL